MGARSQHDGSLRGSAKLRLVVTVALVAAVLAAAPGRPSSAAPPGPTPVVRGPAAFSETPKLRNLDVPRSEADGQVQPARPLHASSDSPGSASGDHAVVDSPEPAALTAPTLTFEGLSDDSNQALGFGSLYPPDPTMDVGPNHIVQMTNLALAVYNKVGTPVLGPVRTSTLFSTLPAGNACRVTDNGDPQVVYDHLADRWLISQFSFPNGSSTPPFHQCIAVSQTPNPTGAYFAYDYVMPNTKFNDYGKFGLWPDAYYMTDNQFAGNTFAGVGAFAFDRLRMLAGDPTASFVYFDLAASFPTAAGMLPSDLDGAPPAPGTPNTFADIASTERGTGPDSIRTYNFHVDFATPASSTFTSTGAVPVPAFDPVDPVGRNDVPQPGTAVGLDSITDRLMQRLQYRIINGVPHLTTNHTVDVSGDVTEAGFQAGVRIEELVGPTWTVQNSTSFAPNPTDRWMGSAALDHAGNLAVGYSASATGLFPSIFYTGRLASDPLNTLGAELLMWPGAGSQTGTSSRWGDYTQMSVDPVDDCTFWYVNEYYQSTQQIDWRTRIGKFAFPECVPVSTSSITGVVRDASTNAPLPDATVRTTNGYYARTDAAGNYTIPAVPGTYELVVSRPGYVTQARPGVANPSVQDFALTVAASRTVSGTVSLASGGPAVAAAVTLGPGMSTTTDAAGHYTLAGVPDGSYTLSVTSPDRCSLDASTPVVVNGNETVNVLLQPKTDAFGHRCREIAGAYAEAPTPVALAGDDASVALPMPFAFSFYGTDYNTANVSSNGHVSFVAASTAFTNGSLPSANAPNAALYPFWDDLNVDSGSAAVFVGETGVAPNRRFTIEWRNVRFFSSSTNRVDFEVVLVEGGAVEFHYRNLDPVVPLELGSSATVGIENATGTDAIQYSFNTAVLSDAKGIRFETVPPVTCNGLTATIVGAGTINGTGGDDVIAGSTGIDTIIGGGGNDTICALGGNDSVNAGDGNDWVDAGADEDTVVDGTGADGVQGGSGNDLLFQSGTVDAGDVLDGGTGIDEVRYSSRAAAVTLTVGNAVADDGGVGEGDKLVGIENARGGSGNDVITGSAAANALYGGAGTDTVSGLSGNDTTDGGPGNDRLTDGAGADSVTGGDGDDLFTQASAPDGGDVLNGGAGVDEVRYTGRTSAVTITLGNALADDGASGEADKLLGIENARTGSGNDNLTGSAAANALYGGAGADTVSGLSGNDTTDGGPGNDRLTDGAGADSVTGGDGDDLFTQASAPDGGDVLNGGAGVDEVRYTGRTSAVTITLGNALADDGASGEADKLLGIETARTGSGNDNLTGSSAANLLVSGAGNDTVGGLAGDDTIIAGTGADVVAGGNDDDVLNIKDGVSGNDTADGGAGTDTASADAGDVVTGVP